jgi:hypothetical protein
MSSAGQKGVLKAKIKRFKWTEIFLGQGDVFCRSKGSPESENKEV